MKLQIDTNLKTIKLEQQAKLVDLLNLIQKMFPDDWESYLIDTNTTIQWVNNWPWRPWYYDRWDYNRWNTVYLGSTGTGNVGTTNNQTLNAYQNSILTSCSSDAPNIINVETNN